MISALACAEEQQEKKLMLAAMKKLAAKLTEDQWTIRSYDTVQEAEQYLLSRPLVDLACCNVSQEAVLEWTKRFRKEYRDSRIMLVADVQLPPTRYLCPQVMASALLLKPYSNEQMLTVMEEFIRSYLEESPDESRSLVISKKEGKLVIPYDRIYYLEAREKKVFLRLLHEEYAIYETLEKLQQGLPDYFVRTHRSFVVNGKMIKAIRLSGHLVQLRDGFEVPLSRSYSSGLKEFGK